MGLSIALISTGRVDPFHVPAALQQAEDDEAFINISEQILRIDATCALQIALIASKKKFESPAACHEFCDMMKPYSLKGAAHVLIIKSCEIQTDALLKIVQDLGFARDDNRDVWPWRWRFLAPRFAVNARRCPANRVELLASIDSSLKLEERIEEHSYRRVLFFYYLLVFAYKDFRFYAGHDTFYQYGQGDSKTDACHSMILPNVKRCIESECRCKEHLWENRFTLKCHFFQALNSTVGLPEKLNRSLDCRIEKRARKLALKILNRVSYGIHTPEEGLLEWVNTLKEVFSDLRGEENTWEKGWLAAEARGVEEIGDNFFRYTALLEMKDAPELKDRLMSHKWSQLQPAEKESAYKGMQRALNGYSSGLDYYEIED